MGNVVEDALDDVEDLDNDVGDFEFVENNSTPFFLSRGCCERLIILVLFIVVDGIVTKH
jgi:hypothetical protein